ncbi:cyclopropane-fatty-acyl-phospholipid synthase family protein [Thioalkalicoccus limnaeus]|uniref:Cyclopropane-fatty-acyl-phospholipid synthase family protein n=1 Tax=Thioalkalicoccus limnaeus TaxID=120681 RepID=A0ABV4BBF0_9GAMM
MSRIKAQVIPWIERGLVPDALVRWGIRDLLRQRLAELPTADCEAAARHKMAFVARMDASAIAEVPDQANAQHYELPPEFFEAMLGPRRKYSCCHWPDGVADLAVAEEASLKLTVERAGIVNGMRVLDLGCGWGSFSLWVASHFPDCQVTAVSNSHGQRGFIESEMARRHLGNLTVITADMNHFAAPTRYDRIVSLEMFEHIRNHRRLYARVADWLEPDGRFFMHIFCHRAHPYLFEEQGPTDWMGRYFFSGGIMPSADLPLLFPDHLRIRDFWCLNGRHYERTLNAWLAQMDARRAQIWPILERTYGAADAALWWVRWRLFLMACAELFGFRRGQEWYVGHYLLGRADQADIG